MKRRREGMIGKGREEKGRDGGCNRRGREGEGKGEHGKKSRSTGTSYSTL